MIREQCRFVDDAGRRCRGPTIAGLKYCPWHRQDGGPRPWGVVHQIRTPSVAKTNSEKAAELMLRLARIKNYAPRVSKPKTIFWLVQRYGYYLDRLLALMSEEQEAGRPVDKLIKQASGPDLQVILRREQQKRLTDPDARTPRYWAIFGFVTAYIARYRRSPSMREIAAATGVGLGQMLGKYLSQLEADGLLVRLPKSRRRDGYYVSSKVKGRL